MAPLKLVEVDSHGVLRLKWWVGNSEAIRDWKRSFLRDVEEDLEISYDLSVGMLIEASTRINDSDTASLSAISFGCGDNSGSTRMTIHRNGAVDVEILALGAETRLLERIDRSLDLVGPIAVRILVMHNFVELYLNDYLLTVQSLHPWARGTLTFRRLEFIFYLTQVESS